MIVDKKKIKHYINEAERLFTSRRVKTKAK